MGKMYTISFNGVAATADQDFFELLVAEGLKKVRVHALYISQRTEVGEAMSEMFHITMKRITGAPTSGSGGSTATPVKVKTESPAALSTCEINNATQLTGGTSVIIHTQSFEALHGLELKFDEDKRPEFDAGTRCVIELEEDPGDSTTFSGTLWIEEVY